jgi:hypothetical protein
MRGLSAIQERAVADAVIDMIQRNSNGLDHLDDALILGAARAGFLISAALVTLNASWDANRFPEAKSSGFPQWCRPMVSASSGPPASRPGDPL